MRCSEFTQTIQKIKIHAVSELKNALKAHNGSYSWHDHELHKFKDDTFPLILGHYLMMPFYGKVKKVWIDKCGSIQIGGQLFNDTEYVIPINNVVPYYIPEITKSIPVTDKIKDVTKPIEL